MSKKILLTMGRSPITLNIARNLKNAGHQVFVTDTIKGHFCHYSSAVSKSFVIPSLRFDRANSIQALLTIILEEKIDYFFPVWEDSFTYSAYKDKFPDHCTLLFSDFTTLDTLHNKWLFSKLQQDLEIIHPKAIAIECEDDLKKIPFKKFVLKACYSRANLKVHFCSKGQKLPKINATKKHPWMAQERLFGKGLCSYTFCKNGVVQASCVYPVGFNFKNNGSVEITPINHPKIEKWIKNFASQLNYTGNLAFDFIESENGKIQAIECNPRATFGLIPLSHNPRFHLALLDSPRDRISPPDKISCVYRPAHFLYGWIKLPPGRTFREYLKVLFKSKDFIYDKQDRKPCTHQPIFYLHWYYNAAKNLQSLPSYFTHDYDYNEQIEYKTPKPIFTKEEKQQLALETL